MYGMLSSGPTSRSRRSSTNTGAANTPTNRTQPSSRFPNSASRNSALRLGGNDASSRYSTVGNSMAPSSAVKRMSSFFKTPAKQAGFKDNRNLLDRDVQSSMNRKVFDFLLLANFPQLNEKMVRFPTKADFKRMFEFILTHLDPQYSLQGKIEEEMPRIMRSLGYPVQLKPSTMQTIGAAHTMPHLLGALTWLIDAVNFAEKISPQDYLLSNEDDNGQRRSLTYGFTIRCYKALGDVPGCAADPSIFKSDSERLIGLLEENDEIAVTNDELSNREEAAMEELAELKRYAGDSRKLEIELAASKDDCNKVIEYQRDLQESVSTAEEKLEDCNNRLAVLEKKLTEMKADNTEKEAKISKQKMSGETARQLRAQKAELNNQVEQLKCAIASTENELYDLRKVAFKEGIALRERYADFMRTLGSVQRYFGIKNDSFEAAMQQHSPNEHNFVEFLQSVKEYIVSISEEVSKMCSDMENEDVEINEQIKAINEHKEALREEFNKLQRDIELKKHGQMLKREDWADEVRKVQLELDVAQNELSALHAARNTKVNGHEQLAEMKKLLQNRKITLTEARNQLIHEISRKLERAFEEWDHIKECRAQLREDERMLRAVIDRMNAPSDDNI